MQSVSNPVLDMDLRRPIEKEFAEYQQLLKQTIASDVPLLDEVSSHLLQSRGKELRPTLLLLSAAACGGINSLTLSLAVSLELLHTASLIHDDVVDESAQRRFRQSVNAVWGSKVAVLAGDYYLAKVLGILPSDTPRIVIDSLVDLVKHLSEGELRQLYHSRDFSVTEADYYLIIQCKTASMFSFCCYAGALSAGASATDCEAFRLFGENLGMAFQIRDDIFDYSSDSSIGKPVGNDLLEGKLTLPLLYALNSLSTEDSSHWYTLLRQEETISPDLVRQLYDLAIAQGGIQYAEQRIDFYCKEAITAISSVKNSPFKESLLSCLNYVAERQI